MQHLQLGIFVVAMIAIAADIAKLPDLLRRS